jgi:hypothetical protein
VTVTLARGVFLAQRAATAHVDELATLGARVESFVGGARWPLGNATLPLARLDFHQFGIRLHGSVGALDWVLPGWQVLYRRHRGLGGGGRPHDDDRGTAAEGVQI